MFLTGPAVALATPRPPTPLTATAVVPPGLTANPTTRPVEAGDRAPGSDQRDPDGRIPVAIAAARPSSATATAGGYPPFS